MYFMQLVIQSTSASVNSKIDKPEKCLNMSKDSDFSADTTCPQALVNEIRHKNNVLPSSSIASTQTGFSILFSHYHAALIRMK